MPPAYVSNTERLRLHNPTWRHVLWNDEALRSACVDAGVADAYESAQTLHVRVDLGRYAILATQGGVSVDMDVISLKPLGQLPQLETSDHLILSECCFNSQLKSWEKRLMGFDVLVNNAFIAAPPRCPTMAALCVFCANLVRKTRHRLPRWIDVLLTTGPLAVSRFVATTQHVQILPCRFVEPLMRHSPKSELSPESVLWHTGSMSWMSHTPLVFFVFLNRYFIVVGAVVVALTTLATVKVAHKFRHPVGTNFSDEQSVQKPKSGRHRHGH